MMMWTAALVLVVGMTEKEALGMAEAAKAKALAAAAAARNDRKPDAQPGYMNLNNLNAQPGYMNYLNGCLLYTSPSPRDRTRSRMPSSA